MGHEALFRQIEQLESARALLLRYANDLKCAYEAERERRARLAQATHELLTLLSTVLAAAPAARNPAAS
ncbi:MAG: hypothetical protein IT305_22665 [Chloroflexi bacterium]|nr:hypothetical protein [Chloroflexota bacterium]